MRAGELRHKIELQEQTETADGMGGFTLSWRTKAAVWAAIAPAYSAEEIQNLQNELLITHQIRIRYYEDLKPSWRIKFGTRYFNIHSILNVDERNREQQIMAKELQE